MTERTRHLLDWLRDAHAMERQAEHRLSAQLSRLEHYPDLCTGIERHLARTRDQQRILEASLRRFGTEPSRLKDAGGRLMAFAQALGVRLASDEVLKGAVGTYAFAHMEIAAYTALIAAAGSSNDVETQRACEDILVQEMAMADWLLAHLPELTRAFLERDEAPGVTAKR